MLLYAALLIDTVQYSPWILTLEFQESGEGTTVTTTFAFATKEDRDAAMNSGMTDGMEKSYQRLDETLSSVGGKS